MLFRFLRWLTYARLVWVYVVRCTQPQQDLPVGRGISSSSGGYIFGIWDRITAISCFLKISIRCHLADCWWQTTDFCHCIWELKRMFRYEVYVRCSLLVYMIWHVESVDWIEETESIMSKNRPSTSRPSTGTVVVTAEAELMTVTALVIVEPDSQFKGLHIRLISSWAECCSNSKVWVDSSGVVIRSM